MTSATGANMGRLKSTAERAHAGWVLAGATIFFSAFFLFQVEPLIAKAILPWFGGSAQVWTSCLLFFQTGLLCGYLYAHLLTERVPPFWQVRIHIALLVVSLVFLPIFPSEFWQPEGSENPLLRILGLLTATIGLPFFLLSATNPLVQAWLARSQDRAPYKLFALSNFGSMLALLTYPLMVEPFLPLRVQTWTWSVGYALFVALCATTAWRFRSGERVALAVAADIGGPVPVWAERALWFGLAALPSAMLLAVTNFLLQNVAAIPLFWILPLALYLLSFIVAFGSLRWFWRPFWYVALAAAIAAMIIAMSGFSSLNDYRFLPLFTICLFVCCLVSHGELASMRPRPRYLTSYYLIIAAGGAFGGLFVAAVAPLVFIANFELQIIVPLTAALIVVAAWWRYRSTERAGIRDALLMISLSVLSGATSYMAVYTFRDLSESRVLARNFYGALRVTDLPSIPGDERRLLLNGSINHGEQYIAPEKRREPITYFSHASGIGVALDELGKEGSLKVGVIGLGTGTIAAYCRPGDTYRFYEINPLVLEFASKEFTYLSDCPTMPTVAMGDARLSLEAEPPQQFDVFAVDAFISDAIPVHLLTREAFDLYWRHLKPDGVLAVHVSNRYVDLAPIVGRAALDNGKMARIISNSSDPVAAVSGATWVLVTSRPGFFDRPALQGSPPVEVPPGFDPWTDDYSNLWRVFSLQR
jgi:SAM-dependent methyltransferase